MSTVLIVGNGFDLDLGLKTSYNDFFKSEFFPDDEGNTELIEAILDPSFNEVLLSISEPVSVFDYLRAYKNIHNWCDIERALGELPYLLESKERIGFSISKDSFDRLHIAFADYLNSVLPENYKNLNTNQYSYKLAKALAGTPDLVVFNYNYTDSFEQIDPFYKDKVNYVHGSLSRNSIIFGVEDKLNVQKEYNFLLKSFSPHYKSHKIKLELKNANHVIFFGHSLSKADYHYFEGLFQELTDCRKIYPNRKITIFTKNDDSRREILWQIRKMNHNKTDILFSNCEFNIFMTDSDDKKIKAFLMTYIIKKYDPSILKE